MPNYTFHCRISPADFDADWAKFFVGNDLIPEIYLRDVNLEEYAEGAIDEIVCWVRGIASRPSLHAPLTSGDPNLFDAALRSRWRKVVDGVIPIAERVRPRIIVCHPVFDKYHSGKARSKWVEENLAFFEYVLDRTRSLDVKIGVENVFDGKPDLIRELLESAGSERLVFCFDTGHFNRYSKVSLARWFRALGDKICEVHVHDNRGGHDDHMPAGNGSFPFPDFADRLGKLDGEILITIEPLAREMADLALDRARRIFKTG